MTRRLSVDGDHATLTLVLVFEVTRRFPGRDGATVSPAAALAWTANWVATRAEPSPVGRTTRSRSARRLAARIAARIARRRWARRKDRLEIVRIPTTRDVPADRKSLRKCL